MLGALIGAGLAAPTWLLASFVEIRQAALAFVLPVAFWAWVFVGGLIGGDPHSGWADAMFVLFCALQGAAYSLVVRGLLRRRNGWAVPCAVWILMLHAVGTLLTLVVQRGPA